MKISTLINLRFKNDENYFFIQCFMVWKKFHVHVKKTPDGQWFEQLETDLGGDSEITIITFVVYTHLAPKKQESIEYIYMSVNNIP